MAIVRYNPFRELRTMQEQMNRLLDLAWNKEAGEELKEGLWQPPVDIYEDEDSVVIKAEVPDIDQKDIEVKIEDNTLTLRGERKLDQSVTKENYHRVERYYGPFQRSFSIPPTIDQERVKASCERGVLTVILPKKEEKKPKQITVEIK
ncbi:MAG TPA: Hsp20/alpha crystallin family protein [Geobacteraceae bacterium]|nr:Hsp20/alpha crystallin family protein [Geobacteraceae bacterium]